MAQTLYQLQHEKKVLEESIKMLIGVFLEINPGISIGNIEFIYKKSEIGYQKESVVLSTEVKVNLKL